MPQVVVGFDVSDPAQQAVRWAAAEARSRDCPLLIVHVLEPQVPVTGGEWATARLFTDDRVREHAEQALTELAAQCRKDIDGLVVDTDVRYGHPATVLVEALDDASLLVLGSSGHGGLSRVLLGSTAAQAVHAAHRPVVVVRNTRQGGPVVVGVDGTEMSDRAIGVAYDFAARWGCELHAVHAWSDRPLDVLATIGLWKPEPSHDVTEEIARTFVNAWAERYPQVVARMIGVHDRPADALLERAEQASLLVVGSRGRSAIQRVLLGSVSHAALYHATCPVAVVPSAE